MRIFMLTRGRTDRQHTQRYCYLDRIKELWPVYYVVPACEYALWDHKQPFVLKVPDEYTTSDIHQFIASYDVNRDPYRIVLDDDLQFYWRDDPEYVNLSGPATYEHVVEIFSWMQNMMTTHQYAHGGVSMREGNNREEEDFSHNTRCVRCHFYDASVLQLEGIDLSEIKAKHDFHMTLSLLERGYPNIVAYKWAQGQMDGSNAKGGCSRYRTKEFMEAAAHRLLELHPKFVTVVEKETKEKAWGGGVRTDVKISWKKGYCAKLKERKLLSDRYPVTSGHPIVVQFPSTENEQKEA